MARPSVIPEVRARLEAYLNDREAEYLGQPDLGGTATLPTTPDGKVNVRGVAQAVGLKTTQEKYLYERDELSSLINLVAEGQGLLPIGWRLTQQAGDKALQERLARQAQAAKAYAQAVGEGQAVQFELLEKHRSAVSEIEALRASNLRLQAQLDAIRAGMFVQVQD